ncbi:hypothetical protein TUBRATIS_22770 [Tubulinosema ratisbonensis]|uniref:WD40 domain-containing protein n=1 Tax=Tubulinosema ratisbonensis TaxID=291195 RepID=A0A437AJG4_9MICR|nr:hypothetical protein TUBRATIS_22770 [Tubulinosema ratisbonensis]
MNLTQENIRSFRKRKIIKDLKKIKEISYSPEGTNLVVSGEGYINAYDTLSANLINTVSVEAQNLTHFTENTLLISKDKEIKHLSLYDNKYLSVYKSHSNSINFINTHNFLDWFITSCSASVKIWDIKNKNPIYELNLLNSLGSFFGDKLIIVYNSVLKMYDTKKLSVPLKSIKIPHNDYNKISVTENLFTISGSKFHQIYDKECNLISPIKTEKNSFVSFTPDSDYYTCSSGSFLFFNDSVSKNKVHTLREEKGDFGNVIFNPCYLQFVSAENNVNFWMPDE